MKEFAVVALSLLAVSVMANAPAPGTPEMKELFALAKTYVNLNHGSFGSVPRTVSAAQQRYREECELRPDRWFRGGYEGYLKTTRLEIAKFLNAGEGRDVVFVENASSGVNAVLRSLSLNRGDSILYLSTAYGMVKNTTDYLRQVIGINLVEVPVRFPGNGTSPTDIHGRPISAAVQEALQNTSTTFKLAIFSHIASIPAWVVPIEELSKICNTSNVPVLIDGAHALGQIPVDVQRLAAAGVSFWVGNAHKWLYSPKGSAVMWVAPWAQGHLVPTVISSAFISGIVDEHSNLLNHFQYTGTRDYTPFTTIADALSFRKWVGEDVINTYNHNLAVWSQERLAEIWNTEVLLPANEIGFMGHARFPVSSAEEMGKIDTALFNEFDTEVTTFPLVDPVTNTTSYWIRLSAQIYLNEHEIEEMAWRVLELKHRFGFA